MTVSEVYNEDNMIGMARYPDNFFDLAIVDPPYGINAPNMQMGKGAKSRGGRSSTAVNLKKERSGRLNSGGGVYQYARGSGQKFILNEVNGFVYEFECGHWVTDCIFCDMIDCKTGLQVSTDKQLKMGF